MARRWAESQVTNTGPEHCRPQQHTLTGHTTASASEHRQVSVTAAGPGLQMDYTNGLYTAQTKKKVDVWI